MIDDPAETCEDGNMNSGDGCSASCVLELPSCFASGTILNGTTGRISEIFTATIARSGTVRSGVKLTGFSRGEVSNLSLNQDLTGANYQEFTTGIQFTSTGQKILTGFLRNQNIGPQECFLGEVEIFHCGDGVIQDGTNGTPDLGETCDDGNTTDGDGCSASCLTEKQQCAVDIVIPDRDGEEIVRGQNDGTGSFTISGIVTGFDATAVFIAELNGDTRNDIVAIGDTDGIIWIENLGSGNF